MRFASLCLLVLAACGAPPTPTGSTCPPDNTLTYDNFGADFMETYCTRCHASNLMGPDRHGAPLYHDFDTLEGILEVHDHIDEQAAIGPDATNRFMPPDGDKPTDDERRRLGQWLACEADALNHPVDAGIADADTADAAPPDAMP